MSKTVVMVDFATATSANPTNQESINILSSVSSATNEHVLTKDTATGNAIFKAPIGVTDHTLLSNIGTNTHAQIDTHIASTSNPHGVIASQVNITDTGAYYTGTETETALQEIGASLASIFSFKTISTNSGTNPVADSLTDTLTLTGSNGITTVGNSTTDTVDIQMTWGGSVSGTTADGFTATLGATSDSTAAAIVVSRNNTQSNATTLIELTSGTSNITGNAGIKFTDAIANTTGSGSIIGIEFGAIKQGTGSATAAAIKLGSSSGGGNGFGIWQTQVGSGVTGTAIGINQATVADGANTGTVSGLSQGDINNGTSTGVAYGIIQQNIRASIGSGAGYGIYQNQIKSATATGAAYGIYQSTLQGSTTSATVEGWHVDKLIANLTDAADAKFFSLNNAQNTNLTVNRTNATAEILHSRTNTATTGTLADNFNLVNFKRTSVQGGAGGTFTSAGSVLKLENVATQGAGTLTDSVNVLEVVQDADSTGAPIYVTQNAVTTTNFKKLLTESTTGVTIWISNGTTPNGALSGTQGDLCLNGPSGQAFYCGGTTTWTGM